MIDANSEEGVVKFHGHMCPGLAWGMRAAEVCLSEVGPNSFGHEVVAIVETNMCGVDAIQFLTGCTLGKGNLVHLDYGKNVYTFIRRGDGRAVRVSARAESQLPSEVAKLFGRVRAGTATDAEKDRFFPLFQGACERILSSPIEELFDVRDVDVEMPPLARIHPSVECASCGEPTMETMVRRLDGELLCRPCFDRSMRGQTPVALAATP